MEMDTIEEQFTGLTASGVETLQKRWKAHPEQVVGSAVVVSVYGSCMVVWSCGGVVRCDRRALSTWCEWWDRPWW
jgi:hypothetical protein